MYCRRCGATLHQGVVICPECGARQRRGISSVRCARCGHRVSLGLTVCPHCGRDVHPAGPRWGLWLAGIAIVAIVALWGMDRLPVEEIKTQVASVRANAARVVQFLGPATSGGRAATPPAAATPLSTVQAIAALPTKATLSPTEVSQPTDAGVGPEVTEAAVVPTEEPATPTASPTPEQTATATATPTDTPTPEPTATPTATATPAPKPGGAVTYKVQTGDTLSSIAAKFGIAWQDLAQANGMTSKSTLRIGQELTIPGAGGGAAPTSAPASSASPTKYVVKSGDSLATIAAKYGLTWQDLAAANGLTATSRLRIGQELVVPVKGSAAQPSPTVAAAQPTVPPPTATPTTAPVALLPAPVLLNPGNGAGYGGANALIELTWKPVENLPAGAGYRVTITYVGEDGTPMEDSVPITTATSIKFPLWLHLKAAQPARAYNWSVRVVQEGTDGHGNEKDILLSPASETRVLYWN